MSTNRPILATASALLAGMLLIGCGTAPGSAGPAETSAPASSGPTGERPSHAPCDVTASKAPLVTPEGPPLVTVTTGANAWMGSLDPAQVAVALYSDGTVISTDAIARPGDPLPTMRIHRLSECEASMAQARFASAVELDMGSPDITDQGDTVVTARAMGAAPRSVSIYALGIGDEYVDNAEQRANRQQLQKAIDLLATPADAESWTPDRLQLTARDAPMDSVPQHGWPGPVTLTRLHSDYSDGCAEITGETAANVIATLAGGPALAFWIDKNASENAFSGSFALVPLVPGQQACGS